jgi:hypothetical protein
MRLPVLGLFTLSGWQFTCPAQAISDTQGPKPMVGFEQPGDDDGVMMNKARGLI